MPKPPRPDGARAHVVSVRLDDRALEAVDLLVRAGLAQSRSEAAAQLVTLGIGAAGSLLEQARAIAGDVERLRREVVAAIKSRDVDRVRALLDRDPSLVHARADTGEPLVLMAVYYGAREVAELLRSRGAELDLFAAAALGDAVRVRQCLDADPRAVGSYSPDGWTPLHLAAYFGHREVAELLLARGADLAAPSRNRMANTPLHAALAGRRCDVARLLIEAGADVNVPDGAGWTPLHHAAHGGAADVVALLLDRGADPGARSETGQTALELARERGHGDVVKLLEVRQRRGGRTGGRPARRRPGGG